MAKADEVYYTPEGSPVLPNKFDVRVRLRHLSKGVLTHDEVKKYLDTLPDESQHADFRTYDSILKEEAEAPSTPDGIAH